MDTLPISDIAIITPAIGETDLPMLAESCIGSIILIGATPILEAMSGISGPNEKNTAFPLPVIMAVMKMAKVIIITISCPEKPTPVDNFTNPSTVPRLIRPFENISAQTIRVMILENVRPIPVQNAFEELKICSRLFVWNKSNIIATKKETRTATVMSISMERPNKFPV